MTMIDTSSSAQSSKQHQEAVGVTQAAHEIVFEESIYTLSESEGTTIARYDAQKRRRLEPSAKPS